MEQSVTAIAEIVDDPAEGIFCSGNRCKDNFLEFPRSYRIEHLHPFELKVLVAVRYNPLQGVVPWHEMADDLLAPTTFGRHNRHLAYVDVSLEDDPALVGCDRRRILATVFFQSGLKSMNVNFLVCILRIIDPKIV